MNDKTRIYSRQLAHPIVLISVSDGKNENLATMAWVSPVSFVPPMLMVAVSPKRYTHELVLKAKEFSIIVLSDEQKELSTLAGTVSGKKKNKWKMEPFRSLRKEPRKIRSPLLQECRANFECKLKNHFTAGDHTIFVGEIVSGDYNPGVNPLLLFDRKYFRLGELIGAYP